MDPTEAQALLKRACTACLILPKQHTQIGEGLAALQMLTSHLPDAVMVSSTKDHNLCFGDADGEAIGCTE